MTENEKAQAGGPKPITAKTRFWYGFGDCWFTIMSNVETFFWNFFMTNIAMFATEVTATISLIAGLVDTGLSWIYGGIINAIKPGKWGRYRSFLITIPWLVPFLYVIEFLKIGEGMMAYSIVLGGYIIAHIVWNVPWVANATLVSACGGTPEGRAALASSRATWNQLAGVAFSYIGPPLAAALVGIVGQNYQYAVLAFILGIVMVFSYWVNFKVTEGYEEIEKPEDIARKKSKTGASAKDMAKALFQNSHLCFLILGDFPKYSIKFVTAAAAAYYFTYVAQNMKLLPVYILASNLCALFGGFISGFLAKKLTTRTTVIGTYVVMSAGCILTYLVYNNIGLVIVLMSVVQMGYGVTYACCTALYGDAAVYSQWKLGVDCRGWIMGLQTFPLKAGVIARAVILNFSLMLVGFNAKVDPSQATDALKRGVAAAFALIPGLFLCIGIVLLFFGYRLTSEKLVQYQAEIDTRKAAAN